MDRRNDQERGVLVMAKTDGRAGHKWRQIREQVLATNTVCWLCGLPGADSVDHIIPLSVAPELAHDLNNLRPAHRRCNSKKGAKVGGAGLRHPVSRGW
jgi:5-methylcytosine-specific restriction endonuclease McrA